MTKLKTLKDFENMIPRYEHGDRALVRICDIKQEAIKWVKEHDLNLLSKEQMWEAHLFIEFFNITEDDLK